MKKLPSLSQLVAWSQSPIEPANRTQMERYGWKEDDLDMLEQLVAEWYGLTPTQVERFMSNPHKCMGHTCPWFDAAHDRFMSLDEAEELRRQ